MKVAFRENRAEPTCVVPYYFFHSTTARRSPATKLQFRLSRPNRLSRRTAKCVSSIRRSGPQSPALSFFQSMQLLFSQAIFTKRSSQEFQETGFAANTSAQAFFFRVFVGAAEDAAESLLAAADFVVAARFVFGFAISSAGSSRLADFHSRSRS
jgi:hypothetical protein